MIISYLYITLLPKIPDEYSCLFLTGPLDSPFLSLAICRVASLAHIDDNLKLLAALTIRFSLPISPADLPPPQTGGHLKLETGR